jgi:hypothetical protein
MKKLQLLGLFVGLSSSAFAQGTVELRNIFNSNTSPTATRDGLFFVCGASGPQLINMDFNASFYGGSDSANLTLLRTFAGPTATGDNAGGPGTFIDLSGTPFTIPGATTNAFFLINAWIGPAPDYFSALFKGSSGIFRNPLGNPLASPPEVPTDLTEMPAVLIGPIGCPEPTTFGLCALGAVALAVFRRGLQSDTIRRQRP